MIDETMTYWLVNSQQKIKCLTKLFTFLISKGIESIKFDYINDEFRLNTNNFLSNKLMDFSINRAFFTKVNIVDSNLLIIPILNIIKDLKSYKGKKVFPDVYFIFEESTFSMHSVYTDSIQLSYVTSKQKDVVLSNMFKLESIIQYKEPDILFKINVEKLNILLNNTYVKENSQIVIKNGQKCEISIIFDDAHGNKKTLKCDTQCLHEIAPRTCPVIIENFILKDLMKFFKDNCVLISLYLNEEKVTYDVVFPDDDIKFKLVSHMTSI